MIPTDRISRTAFVSSQVDQPQHKRNAALPSTPLERQQFLDRCFGQSAADFERLLDIDAAIRHEASLIIRGEDVPSNDAEAVACVRLLANRLLAPGSSLTRLSISHVALPDAAMECLSNALRWNNGLVDLELMDCDISPIGGRMLVAALQGNATLESLTLNHNPGLAGVIADIANWLADNTSLTTLRLAGITSDDIGSGRSNAAMDEGLHRLGLALARNRTLRVLALAHNRLDVLALVRFVQAVGLNPVLKGISFTGCEFGGPLWMRHGAIGGLLHRTNIEELKLAGTDMSVLHVLAMLRYGVDSGTLKIVHLSAGLGVRDDAIKRLMFPSSLEELHVNYCNLSAGTTLSIVRALTQCPRLKVLDLSGNMLDVCASIPLTACFRGNLRELKLDDCLVQSRSSDPPDVAAENLVVAIARDLPQSNCTRLSFGGHFRMTPMALRALLRAVRRCPWIVKLAIPDRYADTALGRAIGRQVEANIRLSQALQTRLQRFMRCLNEHLGDVATRVWQVSISGTELHRDDLAFLRTFASAGSVDRFTYGLDTPPQEPNAEDRPREVE